MKTELLLHFKKRLFILTALSCCRALEVSIPNKEYEAARGGDVTMTCSFTPARTDFTFLILKWEALPLVDNEPVKPVATYFLNSQTDIAPGYEGRATLSVDMATYESALRLTNVAMTDNRSFQCSVTIPNDDEGITAAATTLLVLVAPSKPVCRMQGNAEYWNNISLTCMSQEGSPTPIYAWQSYSVQNIPRRFPAKTNEKDGVLSLYNISMETSGFFICTSTNRIGSASCNFTLSVVPSSMNIGATAGIIGGILAGILILAIIVYCCCRRKNTKDDYEQGSPKAMEFQDKPNPEAAEQYWDDDPNSQPRIEEQKHHEERSERAHSNYSDNLAGRSKQEDAQHSYDSDKDNQHNGYGGSSDHLQDQRDRIRGSRDRLDDQRDHYRGSRDRLDDRRGSRDRLDDQRGSRDRLGDHRGSRDRLDDHRGSRDRLHDHRDRSGSRDRLDDRRYEYGGSREQLDYRHDVSGRSRYDQHDDRYQ